MSTKTPTKELKLDVLVRRVSNQFFAQALQYDIAVQAPTKDLLIQRFNDVIAAQIVLDTEEGREPFSEMREAPKHFWEIFWKCQKPEVLPIYVPAAHNIHLHATFKNEPIASEIQA